MILHKNPNLIKDNLKDYVFQLLRQTICIYNTSTKDKPSIVLVFYYLTL